MDITSKIISTLQTAAAQSVESGAVSKLGKKLLPGVDTTKLQPLASDLLEIRSAVQKAGVSPVSLPYTKTGILESAKEEVFKLLAANPKLKEFYSSISGFSPDSLTPALIRKDLANESFIKGLSIDFQSANFGGNTEDVQNLANVIVKRNSYLQKSAVAQFMSATDGTGVKYSDRTKGVKSTFDKLNSKISSGVSVSTFDEANSLIADGVGTRAIIKALSADDALFALKKGGITDEDIESLKTLWAKSTADGLDVQSSALLNKANSILLTAQTQKLADRLSSALENNEIVMSEIHNYFGKNGIPYFSDEQLEQIYAAWQKSEYAHAGGIFTVVSDINPESKIAQSLGFDADYLQKIAKKSKKASGYTTCQANFIYNSGALGEGQFRGVEVDKFAEYEHFPYDIRKGKTTISEKIWKLTADGKVAVAEELREYEALVKEIAADEAKYAKYNAYLSDTYNYLRKKELGILDIPGVKIEEPKLQIEGLSEHQIELLSKECLEKISRGEFYTFKN